ncbi:hypothetical protein L1049_014837 [Liquidambar formosana]|uniref:Uncharacterized protein n=1 Tax=Liquidambar formosana TaxID=63359 RepID=A0AAP0RWK4_LIQFO
MALELRTKASEERSTPSGRTPKQKRLLWRSEIGFCHDFEFEVEPAVAVAVTAAALLAETLSISMWFFLSSLESEESQFTPLSSIQGLPVMRIPISV